MKKYLSEGLGTFALTLVVALSLASNFPVATPILAALTLGLFVYSLGHISGTHINPAVTIGAWSIKKISSKDAVLYIIAQCIGAIIAMYVAGYFVTTAHPTVNNTIMVGLAELIGTFFFTFGIRSVIFKKTPDTMHGIVIGGSLLLGITIAATMGSNGVLNPAVAIGIKSFNLVYLLGPIAGSLLGMQAFKYLDNN